ncbi:hypothetical protein CHARACLAT_028208, partial [Characodon lateralis]|nr:hypothetical protein [Characodon lateralis]
EEKKLLPTTLILPTSISEEGLTSPAKSLPLWLCQVWCSGGPQNADEQEAVVVTSSSGKQCGDRNEDRRQASRIFCL